MQEIDCTQADRFPFVNKPNNTNATYMVPGMTSFEMHTFGNANASTGKSSFYLFTGDLPEMAMTMWVTAPLAPLCAAQNLFVAGLCADASCSGEIVSYARFEWIVGEGNKFYLCQTAHGLSSVEAALASSIAFADRGTPAVSGCNGGPWIVLEGF